MENELREKGMVLTQQMDAVWEFMASNQSTASNRYPTPMTACTRASTALSPAAASGQLFTSQSSYTTRFVNFNPRNQADEPDAFEARALDAFYARPPSCREFYEITQYQGEEVFRDLAPMRIEEALPRLPWRACRRDRRDRLCQGRMALGRRGRGYQHRHTARRVHGTARRAPWCRTSSSSAACWWRAWSSCTWRSPTLSHGR